MKPCFAGSSRSVLLITTAASVVLLASGQAFTQGTDPAPAGGDKHTLEYFSPKVDLGELRFVFHRNGRLFVELSLPQEMLLDSFVASGRTVPPFLEHGGMCEDLPPNDQEYVFRNIPEARGQKYSVLFYESSHCETRTLSGLTLYPTGDGGFRGFLGVLDGRAPEPKLIGDDYLVGLAFNSDTPAKARRMPAGEIDESRRAAIARFVRRRLCAVDLALLDQSVQSPKFREWVEIFVEYPTLRATLVVVEFTKLEFERERHIKYLFCVLEQAEGFALIPFTQSPRHAFDAGLYYQDDGGQTDVTPVCSELFVLPDIDGNGAHELLVVSTISQLFQLTHGMVHNIETGKAEYQPFWREIRRVYFGP